MEHAICSLRAENNGISAAITNNRPSNMLISRLTWDNLQTNSAELFGRVDTPWNIFLSGFIGAGDTFRGGQNDEDFNLIAPVRAYNNTFSTKTVSIGYAVIDVGYDLARNANYKIGPFVGYTYFSQDVFKFGCQQIANSTGNCITGGLSAPIASSQLIGSEDMTWQGVRVGLSGQVKLAERVKLAADAAFIPYVAPTGWTTTWTGMPIQPVGPWGRRTNPGRAILRCHRTVWCRHRCALLGDVDSGSVLIIPGDLRPNRNAIELAGAFVQMGYRFAPGDAVAAISSAYASVPILSKAPPPFRPTIGRALMSASRAAACGEKASIGQTTASGLHLARHAVVRRGRRPCRRDGRLQFPVLSHIRLRPRGRHVLGRCSRQRSSDRAVPF